VGDSGRGRSRRKTGWQNDYLKWRGKNWYSVSTISKLFGQINYI